MAAFTGSRRLGAARIPALAADDALNKIPVIPAKAGIRAQRASEFLPALP